MADAIKQKYGIEPELIEGSGGVFEVTADGRLIYSKKETGEFPSHELILEKLSAFAQTG